MYSKLKCLPLTKQLLMQRYNIMNSNVIECYRYRSQGVSLSFIGLICYLQLVWKQLPFKLTAGYW